MESIKLCGHCGGENSITASRCGFCLIDFRDVPPKLWPPED